MLKLNIQLFASTYDVIMRQYNGTDWDTLRPQTVSDNVDDSASTTKKFLTAQQRTNLIALHDGSNVFLGLYKNNPAFTGDLTSGTTLKINSGFIGIKGIASNYFGIGGGVGSNTFSLLHNGSSIFDFDTDNEYVMSYEQIKYGPSVIINDSQSLVTKAYVDTVAINIKPAAAVKAISTININLNNPILEIDGYTLANTDRVLLKNQTNSGENGLYTWNSTTQKLTKVLNAGNDNVNGTLVVALHGTENKNDRWYCVNYTLGSWILFDSNIEMIPGAGISISGTSVSIADGGVTNAMLAGSIANSKLSLTPVGALEYGTGNDLKVKALGITNAMLYGDITNDKLAGSIANSKLLLTPVGALEYGTGNDIQVKTGGITNSMLAGSISHSKLADWASFYDDNWAQVADAQVSRPLSEHIGDIYTAIKLLRGTQGYSTDNNQTISDAYSKIATLSGLSAGAVTLKNKISHGTTLPTSNMVTGDLFFLHA